jgi:2-keto-3-deoxy-L-rhamnonate aldolase RhmA
LNENGKNKLFKALRNGETLLGVSNMYPAAGIIEGMCAGWDFVWIDCQHGVDFSRKKYAPNVKAVCYLQTSLFLS